MNKSLKRQIKRGGAGLLLLTLVACGSGSKNSNSTDTSSSDSITSVDSTSDTSTSSLSLYAYNSQIYLNESLQFYAYGGSGSYSYYISSGGGSINSSTGLYYASSYAGTVTIGVQDSYGNSTTTSIYVTSDSSYSSSSSSSCSNSYLGSQTTLASNTVEKSIDLSKYSSLSGYVIVGIGARFSGQNVVALYAKVAKLNSDGTIDESQAYAYKTGDFGSTSKGELYVELPDNFYVYGFGMGVESSGEDVEVIKIWGAKVDGSANVTSTVQCLLDRSGNGGCSSSKSVSSSYTARYKQVVGSSNQALTAFGAGVSSSVVNAVMAKGSTVYTSSSGSCY